MNLTSLFTYLSPFSKRALQRSLILLTLINIPLIGYAQASEREKRDIPPKYQVEMIVFETTALKGWTEEFWPYQVPDIDTENAYPIQPDTTLPQNTTDTLQNISTNQDESNDENNSENNQVNNHVTLVAQPESDTLSEQTPPKKIKNRNHAQLLSPDAQDLWLLTKEAKKLQPKRGYRILLHQSWIQYALPDKKAQPLYFENQPQSEYASDISGTVRLYKQRYAHVEMTFNLDRFIPFKIRPKFAQNEDTEVDFLPDFWTFHLQQARKIKPGELHYIDHPLFGILIQIKKLKPEQLETMTPFLLPPKVNSTNLKSSN